MNRGNFIGKVKCENFFTIRVGIILQSFLLESFLKICIRRFIPMANVFCSVVDSKLKVFGTLLIHGKITVI